MCLKSILLMKIFSTCIPLTQLFKKLAILLIAVVFIGCSGKKEESEGSSAEGVKEKWKEAANETKEYLDAEGKEFKDDVENTISDIDDKIAELKNKLGTKQGEGKDKIQKQIDELEIDKKGLKKKMDEAGENAKETWNEFKSSTKEALSDIEEKIDSIK